MVGRSVVASPSPSLPDQASAKASRKTAEILAFPKIKVAPVADFARDCAKLIWATFPASSMNGVCARASRETGASCPDTFQRILAGITKRPDAYVMHCVLSAATARGIAIPPSLAIRIANGAA